MTESATGSPHSFRLLLNGEPGEEEEEERTESLISLPDKETRKSPLIRFPLVTQLLRHQATDTWAGPLAEFWPLEQSIRRDPLPLLLLKVQSSA